LNVCLIIANPDLIYQFENKKNYNVVNFEFNSKKTGLQDVPEGNSKKFSILFGTTSTPLYNELVAMFI
jgi:hypothetical protein